MKLKVRLNGTNENRWLKWGLKQNPFPQIAKAELDSAMQQLNSLDGDPLKGPDDIRERLKGWSEEFIQICLKEFKPGEIVQFPVNIPDEYCR